MLSFEEAQRLIKLGVTPRLVERAYTERRIRQVAQGYCVQAIQLSRVAQRWGIRGSKPWAMGE